MLFAPCETTELLMARREKPNDEKVSPQERRRRAAQTNGVERRGWTKAEWCYRRHYSESYFYKLKREGRAPREDADGLITLESEKEWEAARAAEQQKPPTAA